MLSNQSRPTNVRHWVTAWLAVAAILAYLSRNSIGAAQIPLRAEMGISEEEMGDILGAFFVFYAFAQIPMGWLGDRIGSRLSIPLFVAAWSVATSLVGVSGAFVVVMASRIANGIAQAGVFPASTRSIAIWNPPGSRAMASGILGAAMSVGGALGVGLTAWMLNYLPARSILAILALPGIVWAIGFWFWFRERPGEHSSVNSSEAELIAAGRANADVGSSNPTGYQMWLGLFLSPATWFICGQQFFRAGAYAFFTTWFPTYLAETKNISIGSSGYLTMLPLIATVVGSTMGGYCSDSVYRWTGSLSAARKGVSSISLAMCASLVLGAYFCTNIASIITLITLGAFLAAIAGPCAYTATMDMGGRNVASLFSTMNMMGNFGAGAFAGFIPDFKNWVESSPQLLEFFGGNSWNAVLPLFAAIYAGAAGCWLLLNMRGTVFDQSLWKVPKPQPEKETNQPSSTA